MTIATAASDSWRKVPRLADAHVTLEALAQDHASGLAAAVADGDLWRLWYTHFPTVDSVGDYIDEALAMRDAGAAMPFVVRDADGVIVGSTRYCRMEPAHRRLEIGYTWYAKRVWGTALNPAAKRLLLAHAFEQMGCIAVEFRTHWHNHRSRAAIARLGAKQDGVLRNHMILADGIVRDTVVFSILDSEWPAVRRGLDMRLGGDR